MDRDVSSERIDDFGRNMLELAHAASRLIYAVQECSRGLLRGATSDDVLRETMPLWRELWTRQRPVMPLDVYCVLEKANIDREKLPVWPGVAFNTWHELAHLLAVETESAFAEMLGWDDSEPAVPEPQRQQELNRFADRLGDRRDGLYGGWHFRVTPRLIEDIAAGVYRERIRAAAWLEVHPPKLGGKTDSEATVRAHLSAIFLTGVPKSPDLVDLMARLDAAKGSGKSNNEIAREFTGETMGNFPKAKRLLTRIRKYNGKKGHPS